MLSSISLPNHSLLKANVALFAAVALWASAFVIIRYAVESFSPGSLALLRFLSASVIALAFYFRPRAQNRLTLRQLPKVFAIGLIGITFYHVSLNTGEVSVTSGLASFVVGQIPVITVVLAMIFMQEKIPTLGYLGLSISLTGVVIIALAKSNGFELDAGLLYLFITALTGSLYILWQKPLLKVLHPFEFIALVIWSGTFGLLIYLPDLIHELPLASPDAIFWVIMCGIFPGTIAYALWSYGIAHIPVTQAVSFHYFIPLFTTLIAWITLHELPSLLALCGGMIALLGSIIVNRAYANR